MFKVLIAIGTVVGFLALIVLGAQWAFNIFVSPTFGTPQIDFLQAIALTIFIILLRGSVTSSNPGAGSARLR